MWIVILNRKADDSSAAPDWGSMYFWNPPACRQAGMSDFIRLENDKLNYFFFAATFFAVSFFVATFFTGFFATFASSAWLESSPLLDA